MMRFGTLAFALLLSACAPRVAPSTPADWAALADVLGSDEYAGVILDELSERLERIHHDLSGDQERALYDVLHADAESQRAAIAHARSAGSRARAEIRTALAADHARTDAAAEALLTPDQIPAYRALMAQVRAYLLDQATHGGRPTGS